MTPSTQRVELEEIREEIADLDTPQDRLAYLIELGQSLPDLPERYQIEDFRVLGCQSMVWVVPKLGDNRIEFIGSSDAPMVRGLVAILIAAYSGKSPSGILAFPIEELFDELHLKAFLTPMRSNGLHSMVQRIQAIAHGALHSPVAQKNHTTNTVAINTIAMQGGIGPVIQNSGSPEKTCPLDPSGQNTPCGVPIATTPPKVLWADWAKLPAIALEGCRRDFPLLAATLPCGKPWVYLDNAASSQRPHSVLECMDRVYKNHYANVHRSGHQLAAETTQAMENARRILAQWMQLESTDQVIFTPGTTAGINLVARSWGDANLRPGDEIVLTEMEHHSNIVPWQQLAQRTGAVIRWIEVLDDYTLDLTSLDRVLNSRTKLLAVTAVSNVLGTINPVRSLADAAHRVGAKVLVDAAQSAPHGKVTPAEWDADWVVFSGHKMLGPTGIGVLAGKREILEAMPPFLGGGNMIKSVTKSGFEQADLPHRFEAGTAAIVEAIAMKPALEYLMRIGSEQILAQERRLTIRAMEGLSTIKNLKVLGPSDIASGKKTGIVSFVLPGVHADQIGQYLNASGIAIRVGHHCAMPLHQRFGLGVSARASFYFYNTESEVDAFVTAVERACQL
jgi:cysteine desulfurase/selenocysteine lyase